MSFSNPAAQAREGAARYIASLLDLLGDRDPLDVQRELPDWIEAFVRTLPTDLADVPEAPGKWSAADTVRHLAHTETVYAYRYRLVYAEDDPIIPGFDQDRWASRLTRDLFRPDDSVALLTHTRRCNLSLLETFTPEDLVRSGRHEERGVESLDQIIRLGAAHDLVHRRQLERIRTRVVG